MTVAQPATRIKTFAFRNPPWQRRELGTTHHFLPFDVEEEDNDADCDRAGSSDVRKNLEQDVGVLMMTHSQVRTSTLEPTVSMTVEPVSDGA